MKKTLFNALILLALSALVLFGSTALVRLGVIDQYLALTLALGSINVVIALSLNLISGFTGQLALGHAGFMAIGAYASAYAMMQLKLPLAIGVLFGGSLSAAAGFMIGFPALRLRGDYLAIVTLGFGEIIRVIMINLPTITGGAAGLKGIPAFTAVMKNQATSAFFWTLLVVIIVLAFLSNLLKSTWGRAIMSVREDEVAARSMGIDIFGYKMFAFTVSAFIAGVGGALYASWAQYLNPDSFRFLKSVDFVIIVVLGGMGSLTGTVIAGYALTWLQEILRFLKDYRLVIYALMLILIMLFQPGGLMGKREFSPTGFLGGGWRIALSRAAAFLRIRTGGKGRS